MGPCDVCQQEEVAFIIGDAKTGEQQFLGIGCFARAGLDLAKAVLPAEEIAATLGPLFVDLAPPEGAEAARSPKRRRAGKAPQEPAAEQVEAQGPPQEPAAAQDG